MKQRIFSFQSRVNSFGFAFNGIRKFFREEQNTWIHLTATIVVGIGAAWFKVSTSEMLALIIVMGLVWVAEIFNTVIERIMDFITTQRNPQVAFIKDLAAGAVLVASIIALITGVIVFIPKLI